MINQEFSHTTKTSLLTKERLLKLLIGQLSEEDKEKLKQELE
ncbi:Hypothetical Phage transcriptional activator [Avibacterium paragallinarum JF4211]|nr:Hypothetical Phage transcriptional activator [Avibacterium paragallinarum JF4211]